MKNIFFIALIILGSCASLNTVSSVEHTANEASSFRYNDSNSNVLYSVANDNENLYVSLNTSETTSIAKILRTGLSIYFDVNGKKAKDLFVQYPLAQKQKLSKEEMSNPGSSNNSSPNTQLTKLLAQMSYQAIYHKLSETESFSVLDKNSEIKIVIESVTSSEITYHLTIPFNKIAISGKSDLSKLSVGIVSGRFDPPDSSAGAGSGSGQGGGQGSGMSGGGQGGGQGRGMSGGGQSQGNMSAMTTPIKFWFKVELQDAK